MNKFDMGEDAIACVRFGIGEGRSRKRETLLLLSQRCVKIQNTTNRKKAMTAEILTPTSTPLTQLTYQVLIEKYDDDLYSAVVWGLPECRSTGSTKEEALKTLHRLLIKRLEKVEIVSMKIDIPKPENPLMKWAGAFKDDPYFDEMLEDIEELRRQKDAQRSEYYHQLDEEEATNKFEVKETAK
jgi:predicted RNase H-like HicB family nuclease